MKRLLLFICAMFVGAANAEPTNTSDNFPLNELMQPDYRYLNSAIYPNTGVYDGDVTVNALYDWDLFSPTAGNYLPANSTTITQCTAGNFCAGATNVHYENFDQGITACSTLGDNSYTQSATGSSLETDCYKDCTVANANIAHASAVTGNNYYGNGTDTCSASACEGGYHTDNNACGANTLTITWANSDNPNTTCTYGGSITTPPAPQHIPGKTFVGWSFFKRIEYIESTGTQSINTGYTPIAGTKMEIRASFYENEDFAECACGTAPLGSEGAMSYFSPLCRVKASQYIYYFNSYHIKAPTVNNNDIIVASIEVNSENTSANIVFDNETTGVHATYNQSGRIQTNSNIRLFSGQGSNKNGVFIPIEFSKLKLYYAKIWQSGVLVRDFIPVKDPKGVPCLYDRIGKRFYYNDAYEYLSGDKYTADFIAGPEI